MDGDEFIIKVKIAQMTGCWPSCNDCEHYAHGENEMSGLFPNLMVDDMIETLSFYEGIGFSIVTKLPVENPIWALLELDGVKLMLQSRGSLCEEFPILAEQSSGGALTLWISNSNVKSLYKKAQFRSEVIKPIGITEYNGATEFVLKDPNGFILHFSDFLL